MQVTIARLYETYPAAVRVVEALLIAGVPAQDISVISNNSDNWLDPGTADAKVIESKPTDIKPSAAQPSDVKSAATKPVEPAKATPDAAEARSDPVEGGLVGAAIGAVAATAGTAIGTLAMLVIPGIGPAVGAGWLFALLVAGAAVGGVTGGLLGALASAGVNEADAAVYAEGVRRGGSVVAARVSPANVPKVESVMEEGAINIAERRADFRRSGWQTFDPAAPPYSADQVRTERLLHRAA
jgi:hypothetical protein